METTRFRKAFRLASETLEDDCQPADLDEEEQDKLIETLKAQDASQNEFYMRTLLAITLLTTIPFFVTFYTNTSAAGKAAAALKIVSLIVTAYITVYVPNPSNGDIVLPFPTSFQGGRPGLDDCVIPLTGILMLGLLLLEWLAEDRWRAHNSLELLEFFPIGTLTINLYARRLMRTVDISSLDDLRYGYKGA